MTKWMLFVLLGLVGLVALVALVGWFLPKGHRARVTVKLPRPPGEVFATIADLAGWPKWRSDVKRVERFERDGKQLARVVGADTVTYEIVADRASLRLTTRIADKLPYGGVWTWEVASAPEGATLTITEDGEVYNPIFRFIARVFMDPTASLRRCQADLSAELVAPR